jgi:hypothetical protein
VGSRNSRNYNKFADKGEKHDSRKSSVASKKSYRIESGSPRESERVVQEN